MVFKMASEKSNDFENMPFLGINIFKVKEVLNFTDYKLGIMPMGFDEDEKKVFFKGVINVRGEYVPVYDVSKWLGYKSFESARSVIIVSEVNGMSIGLHVAYIHGVIEKDWKELKPSSFSDEKIVSETRVDDDLCLIMDIERMVGEIKGQDLETESKVESKLVTDKIVLFADDSRPIRDYVAALLGNMNIKSYIFSDGQGIIDYLNNANDL